MIKIINEVEVPYSKIGVVIDSYMKALVEKTVYEDKADVIYFTYDKIQYEIEVKYLKKDIVYKVIKDCDECKNGTFTMLW